MEKSGLLAQVPCLRCIIIIYTQLARKRDGSWCTEHDELRLDWRESFTISGAKWSRLTAIEGDHDSKRGLRERSERKSPIILHLFLR